MCYPNKQETLWNISATLLQCYSNVNKMFQNVSCLLKVLLNNSIQMRTFSCETFYSQMAPFQDYLPIFRSYHQRLFNLCNDHLTVITIVDIY